MKAILVAAVALTLLSACETFRGTAPSNASLANVEANHGEFGGFNIAKPIWQN